MGALQGLNTRNERNYDVIVKGKNVICRFNDSIPHVPAIRSMVNAFPIILLPILSITALGHPNGLCVSNIDWVSLDFGLLWPE